MRQPGQSSVTACTVPGAAEELGEVGCASGTIGALQGVGFRSAERAQRLWGQDTATCLGKLEGQTTEQARPRSVDLGGSETPNRLETAVSQRLIERISNGQNQDRAV